MICPKCKHTCADNSNFCSFCGYNLSGKKKRNNKSRPKLPNGFGQISEIKSGNMRNRFRAMVTVGTNPETGRPISKLLKPQSYFKTYNEAYEALMEYNKNPYDLSNVITVEQLYAAWSKDYFKKLKGSSSFRNITSAWSYCSSVYKMEVRELRARHIKGCMNEGFVVRGGEKIYASANIKSRIKSMFNLMLDYALEYELVQMNYARTFENDYEEINKTRRGHLTFTDNELDILWKNVEVKNYVDIILFQCYSGWRPQELGLLKVENINLDDMTIVGGMKTEAGTNRIVPIHPAVVGIVLKKIKEANSLASEYLFNCTDGSTHKDSLFLTYDKYNERFKRIIKALNLNPEHKAHDGRVTFITQAKKYHVDEYAIKYMVGHAISDITEKVYTKRDVQWLHDEISKIK